MSCVVVVGRLYHCGRASSDINQYTVGVVRKGNFVRFMCQNCVTLVHNADLALKDINDTINRIWSALNERRDEWRNILRVKLRLPISLKRH